MIFPDWGAFSEESDSAPLPAYTEWAMDWNTGSFALRNGKPYTVSGSEALKIWVRCALHPENIRFLYSAHSSEYGNQLASCMGGAADQGIVENLLRREIRDTLLVSPYIRAVDGFSFQRSGSRMTVCCTVHTLYEDFMTHAEVEIG